MKTNALSHTQKNCVIKLLSINSESRDTAKTRKKYKKINFINLLQQNKTERKSETEN